MAKTPIYTHESLVLRVETLVDALKVSCDHLDRLSIEQGGCLRNGEIEAVVDVLARREPVLARLESIGDQITVIMNDEQCLDALGHDEVRQVRSRLGELEVFAGGIRERDAGNQELMLRQRDALAEQMSSIGHKKNAMNAYSTNRGTPNPTLQDRRG